MICRVWHGWTAPADADALEALLRNAILPGVRERNIPGYLGAQLLRRTAESEVEFMTLLWFSTWEAVRQFAGEDYEAAVLWREARHLLAHYDEQSRHYENVVGVIL